jgi:hypothetical protein
MAKKNDNQKLILAGIIGFAAWQLLRKPAAATTAPHSYTQYPPPPPRQNNQEWVIWVQGILNTFGAVSQLWAPGGPFHGKNISQEQALEIGSGQQYANVAGIKRYAI